MRLIATLRQALKRLRRRRPPRRPGEPPRLLLLVDRPGWAFDHSARALATRLAGSWKVDLRYVIDRPRLDPDAYDLAFVYFWGETWHQRFAFDPERVIKQVSSHRWEDDPAYGPCTPRELAQRHLHDAATVSCTSLRLHTALAAAHPRVVHAANGFEPGLFARRAERQGGLTIGWAGNERDPVKRIAEILVPAAAGHRLLRAVEEAHATMGGFYNQLDVFACCSRHEGEPLTLIEAMACGCFPVCSDVGIVPELIRDGDNGLIVRVPTPAGFRAAFAWCADHLDLVRAAGLRNAAELAGQRTWDALHPRFATLFHDALRQAQQPRLRNDDVAWDTDLAHFREFCAIFARHGRRQLHGITLHGRTATLFRLGSDPVEYAGEDNISRLPYPRIRTLAAGEDFRTRHDLIAFLAASDDDLALHGWYHTDHARMGLAEQRHDLAAGLRELRELFPHKTIRYFIPPFNRINRHTRTGCAELGLHILGTEGVHLEAELEGLRLQPGVWHRYHHHRFHPASAFSFYPLSLGRLEAMFLRQTDEADHAVG